MGNEVGGRMAGMSNGVERPALARVVTRLDDVYRTLKTTAAQRDEMERLLTLVAEKASGDGVAAILPTDVVYEVKVFLTQLAAQREQ